MGNTLLELRQRFNLKRNPSRILQSPITKIVPPDASRRVHMYSITRRKFLVTATSLPAVMYTMAASTRSMDYLGEVVEQGIVPGAALLASRQQTIHLRKVLGTCCLVDRREAPLTLETVHPLYSFSKLITGTMVAIARSEGLLNYSDRVSRHIPEFGGGGKDDVTIRHCLTHSAGLAKVASKPVHQVAGWNEALQDLCASSVEWEPGTQTAYHGWSGAFLAAECVRRVYKGLAWSELCREKLFRPLGAESLSYDLPVPGTEAAVVPQPAPEKPLPNSAAAAFGYAGQPGAGCFGKLGDALKVMHLHLQQGVWESKRLIAPEVFREMHTVQFAKEIAAAQAAGKSPKHESWGLGPLLRGEGPSNGSHQWFGFANQSSASIFGHAGIDTFIGVGHPERGVALVFATTNSPKPADQTGPLRNKVTDLVFRELAS